MRASSVSTTGAAIRPTVLLPESARFLIYTDISQESHFLPRMAVDYNRGTECIPGFRLATVLDDPELRSAIADPRLQLLLTTAYDGAGFSDCMTHSYLSLAFYTPDNTARLVDEYSEFTYRLYVLYHGTGKKFVLMNWEGDNAIYCSQAYTYIHSDEFRKQCTDAYAGLYAGNRGPSDSIQGMILSLKARYLGVELACNARKPKDSRVEWRCCSRRRSVRFTCSTTKVWRAYSMTFSLMRRSTMSPIPATSR